MSAHRSRLPLSGLGAALLLVSLVGPARADTVTTDGDVVAVGTGVSISGSDCPLPASRAGKVTFTRSNEDAPQRFEREETVALSYAASSSGVAVSGPSSVTLPTSYNPNGATFDVPISTTVAAGTETGSASVTVTATQGDYTKSGTYGVTWTCAVPNSGPAVSVTGVDAATYEHGAAPVAGCSWSDDRDGSGTTEPTISGPTGPRADAGLGTVQVSCSYTDSGGRTDSASASYVVVDTAPPVLPALADLRAEATGPDGAVVDGVVGDASDSVDGPRPVTCTPALGSTFPLGSTPVTCRSSDVEGNTADDSFDVVVVDTTAPEVTVPEAMTLDATSRAGAAATFTASASDLVDGSLPVTCSPASGETFPFGSTLVDCRATDAAGNTGGAAFAVTVQDVTDPVVTVPSPATAEATGPHGAAVTWDAPSALDDIDGDLSVVCDHASGDVFALGDTTVSCTATDAAGNTGENLFVVTVQDTTGPAIAVPTDITAEATSSLGAMVDFEVTATDLVDGAVRPTCSHQPGSQFALGATVVTCEAADSRDNHADPATFTVTVVDTTAPTLPKLDDVAGVEATGPEGAVVDYTLGTATDVVDGPVAVVCDPSSGSQLPLGTTTVGCSATDAAGNTASSSFAVTVVDTTAPTFAPVAVPTTEATGPDGAQVDYVAAATDTVDADPVVACSPGSGTTFPVGTTAVSCTATDDSGNVGEFSFTVTVADTTGPVVGTVPSLVLEATSSAGAVHTYHLPTAVDLVDGEVSVTCDPAPGSTFPLGTTEGTCSATDAAGNAGSSGFVVTVADTTAPVIPAMSALSTRATSSAGAVVTYDTPTAEDLVDGDVTVGCLPASGGTFPLGNTVVTCTATDAAGNTATRSFTVTVEVEWSGFLPPLERLTAYKQGSTIPVKFALSGASAGITDLQARVYVRRVGSAAGAELAGTSTSAATSGNLFRYADGQYVFNLSTKGLAVGTYEIRADLGDGRVRTTTVMLR